MKTSLSIFGAALLLCATTQVSAQNIAPPAPQVMPAAASEIPHDVKRAAPMADVAPAAHAPKHTKSAKAAKPAKTHHGKSVGKTKSTAKTKPHHAKKHSH